MVRPAQARVERGVFPERPAHPLVGGGAEFHGDSDELIPVQALFHATNALGALGVPTEWHVSAGIGHGIDQDGLRYGGEFLARRR